ncbi:MAG: hypothetical protein PHV61_10710 [Limnochordia bacterium]|nr:hypothetical protein [Limnochordia bacterium]MDD2630612.1 hypothetical protein [Limnochordia bacterium]
MKTMNKYLRAILLIIGTLVIASLIWYGFLVGLERLSRRRFGVGNFVLYGLGSGLVGAVVGYGLLYGTRWKKGALLQFVSVVSTIAVLTFSNWLSLRQWQSGAILTSVSDLFVNSLRENPYQIFFWLIAIMSAWSIGAKKRAT